MKRKRNRRESGEGWAIIRACPGCGRDEPDCGCEPAERGATEGKTVFRLRVEKRRGKPVTVCQVEGVAQAHLLSLGRELRSACGTGGTVKGNEVELQGDHRDHLRPLLRDRGYRVEG